MLREKEERHTLANPNYKAKEFGLVPHTLENH